MMHLKFKDSSFRKRLRTSCLQFKRYVENTRVYLKLVALLTTHMIYIFQTSQIPYVMGLRNSPTGSYLGKDLGFWTFHATFYPPLLSNGRKKFMAGYELLSEVQRDFDTSVVRLSSRSRQRNLGSSTSPRCRTIKLVWMCVNK